MAKQTVWAFLLIVATAISASSQQTSSQDTSPSTAADASAPTTPQNALPGVTQDASRQGTTSQQTPPPQQPTTPQQPTAPQQPTTSPSAQPSPTPDYVFPDNAERFRRYVKSTVGPFALLRTAASAGFQQASDSPEEWEQGAKGYGKRFASGFGRNAIRQTITYGLDEALDLDTGFERSKRSGFFPRLKDALIQNVTSRTRSGGRVLSAPRLIGVYSAGVISREAWYPERYSYKDGLRSGTTTLLTGFGINVLREFLFNW
jgi:hypothetical protein